MEQSFLQRESARTTAEPGCLGPCLTADFAPSDFDHFTSLKEYLNEQLYASDDEVKTAVELRPVIKIHGSLVTVWWH
jgi:hypothetical protein